MKFFIIILIACLFSLNFAFGQFGFSIQGMVKDTLGNPVKDGTVSLFNQVDSAFITFSVFTNGSFGFYEIKQGVYFLKISSLGYENKYQQIELTKNENIVIAMESRSMSFKEVQVVGYKKAFSYSNGNIKATVDNTILSTLPDAVEILSKLPTVQVSGNREGVSIIGKGNPIIYLGNQRISLAELNAISVNDLKSIEIINNPSAKYEAEGMAVILVTRKNATKDGIKIDLNETAMQKRFFENRTGFNASIKKNKIELKSNFQYNYSKRFEGLIGVLNSESNNYSSNFNGTSIGPRNQYLFGSGLYYQINESDYFSINANGRLQVEVAKTNTNSFLSQVGSETNAITKNTNNASRPYINSNFNYLRKLKKSNSQIFIGGQYSNYRINLSSDIFNNFDNTQLLASEERRQNYAINFGALRLDFEKKLSKNIKWESGGIVNLGNSYTDFEINYVPTLTRNSTHYYYKESNQAIYSQVSGKFKNTNYITGLRIENANLFGGYKENDQILLDKKLLNFFPKVNLSIPLDSLKTLTINYSKTIRRPNYSNANQVTNYITPFLERSNNINLNPTIVNEVSANFQYKSYAIGFSVFQHINPSWYVTEYDSVLKKTRMINKNLDYSKGANFSLTLPFEYKKFSSSNVFYAILNQITDSRALQLKTSPYYYFYSNNQFRLPRNYTFVLAGWITSNQNEGITQRHSQFAVDLSLSKVFYKKLSVAINAFDIFRSLNFVETFNVNGIYSKTTYLENTKEYSIALKYSFGKIKDARYRNKEINENNRLN